jgi:hypothetical protein
MGGQTEQYFEKVLSIKEGGKPVKMGLKKMRGNLSILSLINHAGLFLPYLGFYSGKKSRAERLVHREPMLVIRRRMVKEIRRISSWFSYRSADLSRPFFLYSLPYQEEAYNYYVHGIFDNADLIKSISRALPDGCSLFVKPHPHYCGSDLSVEFARTVSGCRNVRLIPHSSDSKKLLEACLGVITVSGTFGFEAMLYGKPVVVFGNPFYAEEGTVVRITDMMKLPSVLFAIASGNDCGISRQAQKKMIANYCKHQIPISPSLSVFGEVKFELEVCKRIADAIVASRRQTLRLSRNG